LLPETGEDRIEQVSRRRRLRRPSFTDFALTARWDCRRVSAIDAAPFGHLAGRDHAETEISEE
jgi:hypothetical protein